MSEDVWKSEVPTVPGLYCYYDQRHEAEDVIRIANIPTGSVTILRAALSGRWTPLDELPKWFLYGPRIPSAEELASQAAEIARLRGELQECMETLKDCGIGVNPETGKEYCIYCDWVFGTPYPSPDSPPAQHRPECIVSRLANSLGIKEVR